jgi:stage II sporulation protein D
MTGKIIPFSNNRLRWLIRPAAGMLLILIMWGCGAVPELKEGSEGAFVRLPFVRILLENNSTSITITSGTHFSLECTKNNKSLVYQTSQPITFRQDGGKISVRTSRDRIGDGFSEVIVIPRGNKGFLSCRGKRYRGMFKIIPNGSNLRLINIVHMDDYLKGVVPPEIGFVGEEEFEAIKAQAVAARTYSMSHLSQYPGEAFDMKSDISDQVYLGMEVEKTIVSRAVDETSGYVVKYRGEFINAYYHSTCGGYTDDVDAVWDKALIPYLRTVNDSGYCKWSKYFTWKESYTSGQLKIMIEQFLSAERGRVVNIGDIISLFVKSNTTGGRIAELVVETNQGNYSFSGDKIRWVIKRSSNPEMILQSARFKVNTTHNTAGKLVRADFDGGGYGHGVGMCQCGAIGMARGGWKYKNILTFYYKDTEIMKLY